MSRRGLRRGNWSVQELERLRELLPRRGVDVTATLLRRSPDCVYRKALEIMRQRPRRGAWRSADDDLLRRAWGVLDRRLLGVLVGRSPGEVMSRAVALRRSLRSGPWAADEQRHLKELYGTRTDEDLVVALLRPRAEIVEAARRLCLAKDKRFAATAKARRQAGESGVAARAQAMPRWTSEQVRVLAACYPDTENLELARRLGRTVASVANKACQLGLRKTPAFRARIGRANVGLRYGTAEASPGTEIAAIEDAGQEAGASGE